jgi:hypothetical protein
MRLIAPGTTQQPRHSEEEFFLASHADDPFRINVQDENGAVKDTVRYYLSHLQIIFQSWNCKHGFFRSHATSGRRYPTILMRNSNLEIPKLMNVSMPV